LTTRKQPSPELSGTRHQILVIGEAQDVYEPQKKARVVRNMREHALSYLEHQGRITLDQKVAGDEFRRHYETAMLGASQAIDYSRIRVDGGIPADQLTERMQDAHRWLAQAAKVPGVGPVGYSILVAVAGEGKFISEVARSWQGSHSPGSSRTEGYLMERLCEGLDALAQHFGLVAVGRAKRR
jgi:hypothetical protein